MAWKSIPGETPLDDVSGLKLKGVKTRNVLNAHEAVNVHTATMKYLAKKPSRKTAPFTLSRC